MTIKELKKLLTSAEKQGVKDVLVAIDEEWNMFFKDIEIELDDKNRAIIFGLSGSEEQQ